MEPGAVGREPRRRRWLAVLVALGAMGALGTWMTWASFSATVTNEGNLVSAGTVTISDDAAAVPLYDVAGRPPGQPLERCVEVTYTGSLLADVRLYATPVDAGDHVTLELTPGSGSGSADCVGFMPDGGPLFDGTLADFAGTHDSWESGVELPPAEGWDAGERVSLRFRLEQLPTATPSATGPHSYVWEARSR